MWASANMHGNARSVAKINNIFATGGLVPVREVCAATGEMQSSVRRLLSEQTIALAFGEPLVV